MAGDYQKVTFKNGEAPAINATNLNHMQTQYDKAKELVDTHKAERRQIFPLDMQVRRQTHSRRIIMQFSETSTWCSYGRHQKECWKQTQNLQ